VVERADGVCLGGMGGLGSAPLFRVKSIPKTALTVCPRVWIVPMTIAMGGNYPTTNPSSYCWFAVLGLRSTETKPGIASTTKEKGESF
jgi:hypothetical protein